MLLLHDYVKRHQVGELLFSPADIEFDLRTLVQPDIFVAPFVGGRPRNWPAILELRLEWRPAGAPEPLSIDLPSFFRDVLDES